MIGGVTDQIQPTMGKKKTPVTVTIKKSRKGGYTFTIDDVGGGPHIKGKHRYTIAKDARRGALRKLKACTSSGIPGSGWHFTGGYKWYTPDGREIVFK